MKVYLKKLKKGVNASGEYNQVTNQLTVLTNSKVSSDIAYSNTFRGAKSIEKLRKDIINNKNVLIRDITFKSPSTAGNFVTGRSTNGWDAWTDENGKSLKELFKNE